MSYRSRAASLTASFVVTVASACTSNPSAPQTTAVEKPADETPPEDAKTSADAKTPPEIIKEPKVSSWGPTIHTATPGQCRYMPGGSCEEGSTCNPPPPMEIDCPPEHRKDTDPKGSHDDVDDERPDDKKDWVRVKPGISVWNGKCQYLPARLCPMSGNGGGCTSVERPYVACTKPGDAGHPKPPKGKDTHIHVAPFQEKRAVSGCVDYPEFWCEERRPCTLPKGERVACKGA